MFWSLTLLKKKKQEGKLKSFKEDRNVIVTSQLNVKIPSFQG